MSWINFYAKEEFHPEFGKYYKINYIQMETDRLLEMEWRNNRGQDIRCYDDMTGELLTPAELADLETGALLPQILPDEPKSKINHLVRLTHKQKNRKYKPRIALPKELRKAVYELYNHKCVRCNSEHANQIHHSDGNPSNNNIRNLKLCCYDCHLILDGKKKFKAIENV